MEILIIAGLIWLLFGKQGSGSLDFSVKPPIVGVDTEPPGWSFPYSSHSDGDGLFPAK
jgi:hypothetical protein